MSNPNEKKYWLCTLVYQDKQHFRSIIKETFDEAKQWAIDEIRSTNREIEGFIPTYLHQNNQIQVRYDNLTGYCNINLCEIQLDHVILWSLEK